MDSIDRVPITIYTDGSCTTKGIKAGGFGVFVIQGDTYLTLRRGYWNTTTTRMEMMAVLAAVEMIDPNIPTAVKIISDSQFVVNSFKLGWLQQWRLNGWQGVKNPELWNRILKSISLRPKMKFQFVWTPGHKAELDNEVVFGNACADALANYKTQDKFIQDKPLEGFSWFHHEGSDVVFIEKTERYEELNKMGDVLLLGDCYYATEEELFDRLNGTTLFDAYYSGKLDVKLQIETI